MAADPFDEELARFRAKYGAQATTPQDSSALRRVGDLGIDVARGAIGLGKAAVGVGNLATAGALQRGIQDYYRPDEAEQFLSQYYGAERQAEERKIQESQGFLGRAGALATEPGALVGRAIQSLPSMLPAIKGAQLAQAAGLSRGAIGTAAAFGEGLTTAAQQGQEVIGRDSENVAGMYMQVPAGVVTGAISKLAGRFGGDIEAAMAGRGLGLSGALPERVAKGAFGEGVAEEFPQSMQEQMFMNLAEGRPWNENVLEAGAEGMLIGGLTGGVFGALSPQEIEAAIKQEEETPSATQPPPAAGAAPVAEQPLEPITPAPAAPVVDEVLPTAVEILAPELAAQPTESSDLIKGEAPQTAALREAAEKTKARIQFQDNIKALYAEEYAAHHQSDPKKGVLTAAVNRIAQGKGTIEEVVAAIDEQLAKPVNNKNYDSQEVLMRLRARLVPEQSVPVEPAVEVSPEEKLASEFSVANLQRIADRLKREEVIQDPVQDSTSQAAVSPQVQPSPLPELGAPLAVTEPAQQPGAAVGTTQGGNETDFVTKQATPVASEATPLARVGTTPKNSQPVTVRDGVIYVGDEPAVDYDTGEDVRATGSSVEEIGKALRAAGVLTTKQKVFGIGKTVASTKDVGTRDGVRAVVTGATTLGDALSAVLKAKISLTPAQRALIVRLLKIKPAMNARFVLGEHPNYTGEYSPVDHELRLYNDSVTTLLHESVHAATVAAIDKHVRHDDAGNLEKRPVGITPEGKQLVAVYDAVVAEVKRRTWNKYAFYGLTDFYEFIAEAYTDADFQRMLSGVPSIRTGKQSTLWADFVSAVRKMLGVPTAYESALDDVIREGAILFKGKTITSLGEIDEARSARPSGQTVGTVLQRLKGEFGVGKVKASEIDEQRAGAVRVLYRGTNDSSERIKGGIAEGTLFAAADESVAKSYAGTDGRVERIGVKPDAKILVEGSAEYAKVTGRRRGKLINTMRNGENLLTASNEVAEQARAAGYDAVEFTSMRDLGIAIFNEAMFVRDYDPARPEIAESLSARPSGQTVGTVLQRLKGEFGIDGISRLVSKGVLNVVQSVNNLPLHLQEAVADNSPAFYINGKVYMIADRLSPAGIRKALLHELGEHYGLEDMLGMRRYREVLKEVIKLAETDGDIKAALEYVQRVYPKLKDGSQRQAREVIAHLGETAPDHNLWQKIVSWVKTWLLKQGFTKVKDISAADLQDFVARSARRGLRGDVRMYSRNKLFSAEAPEGVQEQRVDDEFTRRRDQQLDAEDAAEFATLAKQANYEETQASVKSAADWVGKNRGLAVKAKALYDAPISINDELGTDTLGVKQALKTMDVVWQLLNEAAYGDANATTYYGAPVSLEESKQTARSRLMSMVLNKRLDTARSDMLKYVAGVTAWRKQANMRSKYQRADAKAIDAILPARSVKSIQEIDEARWEATLPQQVGNTIAAVKANVPVQDLWARAKKFGLKALMLHHIEEMYGDKFKITKDGKTRRPVREFIDALLRMGRARDELQRQAGAVLQRSVNLPAQSKARLDKARSYLSLYGFMSKNILKDGKLVGVEVESWGDMAPEEAKKIWQGLTPKERLAYADMRADIDRQHRGLLHAIKAQLEMYGPKAQSLIKDITIAAGKLKGDYFPLFRTGDHVVVWKSKQYQAAEREGNDAEMTRMKKLLDSPHYIVERFETLDDAKKFQSELNNKGKLRGDTDEQVDGDALYYKQPEFIPGLDRVPQSFVQKLNEAIDINLEDIDARIQGAKNAGDTIQAQWLEQQKEMAQYNDELKALIVQLYVQALPEYSSAKRHLRRSGIAGFSTDSIKTFANYSERVAGATAKALYMQQVLDSLTLAGEAAREAGKAGDPTFQDVVDVLRQHQEAIMNPRHRPGAWQGWLSNAAYIWYLGMTPAFALTNLSQGFLVSAPVIAGRLGMNQLKVQKALIQAMGDAFGVNKSWVAEAEGNIFKRVYNAKPGYLEVPQVDADGNPTGLTDLVLDLSGSKLSEEEQALVRTLYEQSAIDINQTNDLVTSAEGMPIKMSESMKVLSLFAHHSEVLNRIATGLAAYRMAKEMKGAKGTALDPQAFAAKIIDDTHFNYMNTNAPLFLKPGYNPVATIMGQFRKYQIGMLTLLGRNMALAIRGAYRAAKGGVRSEEEVIALRTLNGLLMSHAVVAGSLGMPLVGSVAALVAAALDDDDDPWDKERVVAEYRNWLAEMMGVDAAEVAAHGVFRLPGVKDVLPATLGERVGQQDIASPMRNLRASNRETARDTMLKTLGSAISGPAGGMAGDLLTAWEMIGKGEFERGVEYATPKFVRDAFKSYRFADEGVTTSRGETRIGPETFEGMDIFWQSVGFTPSEVTELYRAQGAVQGYSEALAARRSVLISRFANARMEGDMEEAARVRDDLIDAFNKANPEARILPKDLLGAYRSRTRTQQRINEQGIEVNRRRPGEADLGRFANVE